MGTAPLRLSGPAGVPMKEIVPSSRRDTPKPAVGQADPSSPELVLVDPQLGAYARTLLRDPDDTLERIERRLAEAALQWPITGHVEPFVRPRAVAHRSWAARTGGARRRLFVGGLTAVAAITAVLVGIRVDFAGTQAGALSPTFTSQANTLESRPAERPVSGTTQAPRNAAPRSTVHGVTPVPSRFAWASVDGASGYHVAFYRGSTLVFAVDTAKTGVTLPGRWRFAGEPHRLESGTYRWYVWAVVGGRRAAEAAVQSRLTVA